MYKFLVVAIVLSLVAMVYAQIDIMRTDSHVSVPEPHKICRINYVGDVLGGAYYAPKSGECETSQELLKKRG